MKVGMIGAGGRASGAHYPSLYEMSDAEIVAICDLDKDRLNKAADKYGVKHQFTDYKTMLNTIDLDAVYIIMHPKFLDPLVTYCLKNGKNVFTEKPPGMDLEETKKWARIAKEKECITGVTFQRRFHPCVTEAKRILEEKEKIKYCLAAFHKPGEWEGYGGIYGGWSLTEDVVHVIDLLRWIGGDVKKVHSLTGQLYSNVEGHLNFYTALLEYESGGVGILNSNRTSGGRSIYFEMYSKGASAFGNIPGIVGEDNLKIINNGKTKIIRNEEIVGDKSPTHFDGSFQVNRHFIDCLKENKQPVTNFSDAVKTMEIIKKIKVGPRTS